MRLLAQLRQRKLVQWALAYAAAAFALLQGVDLIAQRFDWSPALSRALIIAAFAGFFATLVLAWYHGERGAQKPVRSELLLLALVLAAGGGLVWKFAPVAPTAAPAAAVAPAPPVPSSAPAAEDKSIAVMPFANMSADPADAYFADGLSEEVINSLSRVPDLRVAARTSSFALRDSKATAPELARKLRVATLLEGSVRRAGDRLRMTAQLVRASDGFQLWSETYDRSSDDIIAIQEEVARQIALALKTATDPRALADMQRAGTRLVPAYDAYLKGLALRSQATTSGDYGLYDDALAAFDQAVALDPEFADAYAGSVALAREATDIAAPMSPAALATPYPQRIRELARRLDLASRHARDRAQASYYRSLRAWMDFRLLDALRLTEEFLAAHPEDVDGLGQAANLARFVGRDDLYQAYAARMERLTDSPGALGTAMSSFAWLPDRERSVRIARQALALYPDSSDTAYQAQRVFLTAGLVEAAAPLVDFDMDAERKAVVRMRQACGEGRRRDAEAVFAADLAHSNDPAMVWHGLLLLGRDDEAARVLEPFDTPESLYALSSFMIYPKFDARRYPVLLAHLARQGLPPRPVTPEPYNCPPGSTSP